MFVIREDYNQNLYVILSIFSEEFSKMSLVSVIYFWDIRKFTVFVLE